MYINLQKGVSTIDDLLIYGYKSLGRNKQGQRVYRAVLEEPVVRGFYRRTDIPQAYKSSSFAVVDDSGKVVDQYIRRVGTYGSPTDSARKNVSEFIKVNTEAPGRIKGIHYTETVPKATPEVGTFHVYTESIAPRQGVDYQKVFYDATTSGKLKNAHMQIEYASPRTTKPLKGEYVVDPAWTQKASVRQNGMRKPKDQFKFSPEYENCMYEAKAPLSSEVKYPYTITALRNPGYYRQYAGPLEVRSGHFLN